MKITIFGLTISSSWGNGHATPYRAILKALHRTGVAVTFFEKDLSYYASHRDFSSCDYCDLVLYSDWMQVRSQALTQARESDVVITASYLPDGATISDELLNLPGPLHVFYDLDTPITLKKLATGGVDYLRSDQIPEFDLYLSFTGGEILHRLEHEFGAQKARPLYGCVDPDEYLPVAPRPNFRCSLSYMGTYSSDRQQKLEQLFLEPALRSPDEGFLLAGSLYPFHWQWPSNVRRLEHVAPSDHPALYSSSRATLNLTRGDMAEAGYCPSGRFFEAAACETPLLTDYWTGLDSFFDLKQELQVVSSANDVISALQSPDHDLRRMAGRARERTLEEHTGATRAQELLAYCVDARFRTASALEAAS